MYFELNGDCSIPARPRCKKEKSVKGIFSFDEHSRFLPFAVA